MGKWRILHWRHILIYVYDDYLRQIVIRYEFSVINYRLK